MKARTRRLTLAALGVGFVLSSFVASAQPEDPAMGTWTLIAAKSKFSPGPAPKSITVTFEPVTNGMHAVAILVAPTGATVRNEYTAIYDGKDAPLTGVDVADTVALKRIDSHTTERMDKKNGKVVQTYVRKVSADGKTMTVTQKGTGADGKAVNNVVVLEKK